MIDHAFRVAAAKCKCRSATHPCSSKQFTHHSHSQPALCGQLSFERPKFFPRFTKQYCSALVAAAPPLEDASLLEALPCFLSASKVHCREVLAPQAQSANDLELALGALCQASNIAEVPKRILQAFLPPSCSHG